VFLLNENLKESKKCWNRSTNFNRNYTWHGTNERYLEVGVMGQQMNVENVVPSEIVEEDQMEVGEDVGETF